YGGCEPGRRVADAPCFQLGAKYNGIITFRRGDVSAAADREDGNGPRSRYWGFTALLLIFGLSAPIPAQDKDKSDKGSRQTKAATAPAAGEKIELKWKFEKDKPFYQEMTTKTQQDMQVMAMPVKQTQDQTFYFSWQFKDEDKDKNTVVTQKIEGVK